MKIVGKTLHLTLKKKWFDMILSGEKTEEYREIKPYWFVRLMTFYNDEEHDEDDINDICRAYQNPYKFGYTSVFDINDFNKVIPRDFDKIKFINGYGNDKPSFVIELKKIDITTGKEKWGADESKRYFVLKLGRILSKSNCG